jgi:hypothetical protein
MLLLPLLYVLCRVISASSFVPVARPGVRRFLHSTEKNIDQNEYVLNTLRAVNVLRRDIPVMFDIEFDSSIYARDVELHTHYGFRVYGLDAYKNVISVVSAFKEIFVDDVRTTYSLYIDDSSSCIVVHWHSRWNIRAMRRSYNVNGVSRYYMDDCGKVKIHELDRHGASVQLCRDPREGWYLSHWLLYKQARLLERPYFKLVH